MLKIRKERKNTWWNISEVIKWDGKQVSRPNMIGWLYQIMQEKPSLLEVMTRKASPLSDLPKVFQQTVLLFKGYILQHKTAKQIRTFITQSR